MPSFTLDFHFSLRLRFYSALAPKTPGPFAMRQVRIFRIISMNRKPTRKQG
jgi:hypothetical protein